MQIFIDFVSVPSLVHLSGIQLVIQINKWITWPNQIRWSHQKQKD